MIEGGLLRAGSRAWPRADPVHRAVVRRCAIPPDECHCAPPRFAIAVQAAPNAALADTSPIYRGFLRHQRVREFALTKPLIYKITGVRGNHEGSMLLWVSILALFGGLPRLGNNLPLSLRAHVLAVQARRQRSICSSSSPRIRFASRQPADRRPRPQSGAAGYRPSAVHPPMLYLGCRFLDFVLPFCRRADRGPD